ncbi:prolyl endopeptidase-like isoform X2 [Eublepharis macularius]|uniref:Prolyl endopeptidase n=1 Tax=Eublepharis macularius TaxID=481883 RepID=A0AA97KKM7_EUBMA|nr:prolyl endopeptidase-like isoform X2 [Eublepharis macularius]
MHLSTKYFLQIMKDTVGHCIDSKCSPTLRLYSQTKSQIFFHTKNFRNACIVPSSQGGVQPWRQFSYKDLLKSEQKHFSAFKSNYTEKTERLKQRLEAHYEKYSSNLGSLVIKIGEYVYFEENGCICRSRLEEADEGNIEVLFNMEDLPFCDFLIQRIRISPDHRYIAVGIKSANSEDSASIIVKLSTQPVIERIIPNVFSFEWATNDILFYTIQKNLRCHEVYFYDFSKKLSELVYTEQDARYFVDLYCTKDKRFLTINSNSKTTSEVWLIDCHHPFKPPVIVQQRTKGVIYHVEHRNNYLYILTTDGDPMGYKLPAWACSLELEPHPEYTSSTCYFWLASPVQPPIRFAYSLVENKLIELTEQEMPIAVNCHAVRLEAKSKDEIWVPITVFHKANSVELHRKPLLIHVYGAYGTDVNMSFKPENLMLIEDGWMLAYCHVRGGGELGLAWHKDGCTTKKHNGIHDLKACINLLHKLGFSCPMYTALASLSAGGVLAGALYNSDPHLIRAMVLQSPFLDVLNTMLDPHLPLTIEEQEEWGNPLVDENCKEYIKSYCPYQNIRPQHYPSVFITVSENDQRVPLAGLLRYICKLRKAVRDYAEAKTTDEKGLQMPSVILDVQPGGSHCASSWEDSLNQVAVQLTFLYNELGLDTQK